MTQLTKHITIKNALGEPRAYLSPDSDGIKDCYIDRRNNGEAKLEFALPLYSEKWAELTPECRIIADGREFTILKPDAIDVERSQDGKRWGKVMAEESWALLDKRDITVSNDPQTPQPADLQVTILSGGASAGGYPQGSAGSVLSYLLQDTEWTLGTVDVDGSYDIETEKLSLLQNIKKVQELWGGLLIWEYVLDEKGNVTQRKLHLRDETKWQNYTGFEVRYKKNLKSITRTANHDIVTKLYPFGENDLDIASVNDGKKYLTNFTYTNNVYVGFFMKQEIGEPQVLKEKATEVLAKMCKPRYTYRTGLVDVRTLPEYSHEDFSLGDMVNVVDPDIGTARVRIQRHKYNVFQPWICELEIGEPEVRLVAQLKNGIDSANFVKEVLRPSPTVGNILKGFVDTFTTTINGAKGDYTLIDGVSTWWNRDEHGDRTGEIVRISPKGIGLSDDGGQNYTPAIIGEGILSNKIIVNDLYALSTSDGYTNLKADGIHVYDDNASERVHAGWWYDKNDVKRFGFKARGDGFSIDTSEGIKVTSDNGITAMLNATEGIVIGERNSADDGWSSKNFFVDTNGRLKANDIDVYGNIDCSSLKIGGVNALTTNDKISVSAIEDLIVGGNVSMGANAVIQWEQIADPPPGVELPSYITATKITQTTIESPNITGGTITGGEIKSNSIIDVGTDIKVGSRVLINGENYGAIEIQIDGQPRAVIEYDPLGKRLDLSTLVDGGRICANGQRIDTPPVAVFG